MASTGQEHVFKIYFLTNKQVISQHEDLTSQLINMTIGGRNVPP